MDRDKVKKKEIDLTVQEAAKRLGVTSRSILNYINSKEIEAIKVGKSWFIRRASLDSFSNRYGIGVEVISGNFPKVSENEENSEKIEKVTKKAAELKYTVSDLKLFIKSKEILTELEIEKLSVSSEVEKDWKN